MSAILRDHADRRPLLLVRMRIMAGLRDYFSKHGFVEVETPALTVSPGNETHLHAFATDLVNPRGAHERRYLRTSPEFACKKLSRPASLASSSLPARSATASAARCIGRNSH